MFGNQGKRWKVTGPTEQAKPYKARAAAAKEAHRLNRVHGTTAYGVARHFGL